MAYGPGVNEVNYTDLPPTGDTVNSAFQKTQNQFDALYTGLNGDIVRASEAEVNTATDTTKLVTPGTLLKGKVNGVASLNALGKVTGTELPDASATVKGVIELATDAEVITGSDTERAVTPAGLLAGFPTRLRSNLLGTVSQTDGVPTGAVIESGSNANGSYVKFADGTFLCWHTVNLTGLSVAASVAIYAANSWTLPVAAAGGVFVKTIVNATLVTSDSKHLYGGFSLLSEIVSVYNTGAKSSEVTPGQAISVMGSSVCASADIRLFAYGRWY